MEWLKDNRGKGQTQGAGTVEPLQAAANSGVGAISEYAHVTKMRERLREMTKRRWEGVGRSGVERRRKGERWSAMGDHGQYLPADTGLRRAWNISREDYSSSFQSNIGPKSSVNDSYIRGGPSGKSSRIKVERGSRLEMRRTGDRSSRRMYRKPVPDVDGPGVRC